MKPQETRVLFYLWLVVLGAFTLSALVNVVLILVGVHEPVAWSETRFIVKKTFTYVFYAGLVSIVWGLLGRSAFKRVLAFLVVTGLCIGFSYLQYAQLPSKLPLSESARLLEDDFRCVGMLIGLGGWFLVWRLRGKQTSNGTSEVDGTSLMIRD
jgi:hypothetical protein